jgi:hypothetical protein
MFTFCSGSVIQLKFNEKIGILLRLFFKFILQLQRRHSNSAFLIQDLLAAFGGVLGLCTGFRKTQKMVLAVHSPPPPPRFYGQPTQLFCNLKLTIRYSKAFVFNGNPKRVNLDWQNIILRWFCISFSLCIG